MLVASLNIRRGGARRSKALFDLVHAHAPDVIVLLEWRDNPAGKEIRTRAEITGLAVAPQFLPRQLRTA